MILGSLVPGVPLLQVSPLFKKNFAQMLKFRYNENTNQTIVLFKALILLVNILYTTICAYVALP